MSRGDDPTYKTGSQGVIREEGAPEEEIAVPRTLTKRQWYAEREIDDIKRRLDEGNRNFSNQRTSNEGINQRISDLRLELTQRIGELQVEFTRKIGETQTGLDGKISQETTKVATSLKVLEDTVNPRVVWWKVVGWLAAFIVPVIIAISGWIWIASRYPDRVEFHNLDDRVQKIETFKIVIEKGGKP